MALVPYKLLFGVYNFLPPLLVLEAGGGPVGVGLVGALHLIGLLFGPLVWSRFCHVTSRRNVVVLGYLGLVAGLLLLTHPGLMYAAVFTMAFFPQAIYFAVMAELKQREGSLSHSIGRIGQVSQLAWAVGLLCGFAFTQFLTLQQTVWALLGMAVFLVPVVARAVGEESVNVFINGFEELRNLRMWAMSQVGALNVTAPRLKADARAYWFYLMGVVFSLASGITFSQISTFLETEFSASRLVYICFFIDAVCSAATYRAGSERRWASFKAGYPLRIVAFLVLMASARLHNLLLFLSFFVLSGTSWGFIMMFFEYAGLKLGKDVLGTVLSLRMLAYSLASAASGFMIERYGFNFVFSLGFLVFTLTALSHTRFEHERLEVEARPARKDLQKGIGQPSEQAG
jgi:MFS family permease